MKKSKSIVLRFGAGLMSAAIIGSSFLMLGSLPAVQADAYSGTDYGLASTSQKGVILHCWNWSYKNIKKYCNSIGEYQFYSDEMLQDIDKFVYKEDYDLDVYFSVLCNRLIDRIYNGEHLEKQLEICSKYNALKSLKSLNTKQFIINWNLELEQI